MDSRINDLTGISDSEIASYFSGLKLIVDSGAFEGFAGVEARSVFLSQITGGLLTKVIDIGDWDMVATERISIDLTLYGITKANVRGAQCWIRVDSDVPQTVLNEYSFDLAGTDINWVINGNVGTRDFIGTANQMQLSRNPLGVFNSEYFDMTSYNRGWLTIQYLP